MVTHATGIPVFNSVTMKFSVQTLELVDPVFLIEDLVVPKDTQELQSMYLGCIQRNVNPSSVASNIFAVWKK